MAIRINSEEIPATVIEAKRWWRETIRRTLKETTEGYRAAASAAISRSFLELEEYQTAEVILAYWSVGREVSTHELIEAMLADGKTVCLPKCVDLDENGCRTGIVEAMEAHQIRDVSGLSRGAYGIPEPGDSDPVIAPDRIDLVMLPCMACDKTCGRIGHGAGYYDKYLTMIRDDCRTAALCFEAVLADKLPAEEHDKPVDAVVTENTVYRWRP